MKPTLRKKHVKRILGVSVFIVVLLFVGNYLVRHNLEKIIQSLVARESDGKYKLEIQKVKFQGHLKKLKAYNAHLYVMDTASRQSRTDVQFPYIEFQLKNIWHILFNKKLELDSVICNNPTFNITPTINDSTQKVSLPRQLGELYLQIEKVMNVMQVARTRFTGSTINLYLPGDSTKVIRFTGIDFGVDGFGTNTKSASKEHFFFSENIFLHSGPQSFIFPDGQHSLQFGHLDISTDKQLINIYQCTLTGASPDSVSGKYKIYFDTLRLVNTDFKALYLRGLIKVDSIYCKNSDLDFSFVAAKRNKKITADSLINTFIKSLFGDIAVNYIGILNSNVSLKSTRDEKVLTFFSRGNNFQLKQIRITGNSPEPVQVGSIDFNVKNYRSFTDDSLYEITFDSVSLTNKELFLANFGLVPGIKNNHHALRGLHIPQLALSGLSLGELIFEKKIQLDKATLLQPSLIIESKGGKENKIKKPLFDLFNDIEQYFNVQKLAIEEGEVTYLFSDGGNHSLVFEKVNSEIFLKYLLQSTGINSLETSVDQLSFSKAIYNNGLQQLLLQNGLLDGDKRDFTISNFEYKDKKELVQLHAQDLLLSGIGINDTADEEEINLQKFAWKAGKISSIVLPPKNEAEKKFFPFSINVDTISLPQTDVLVNLPNNFQLQTFLHHFEMLQFRKPADAPVYFEKALFDGGTLTMQSPVLSIQTDTFSIRNSANSFVQNISIAYKKGRDSIHVQIPSMSGLPGITNFEKVRNWTGFHLYKPTIYWAMHEEADSVQQRKPGKAKAPFVFENLKVDSAKMLIEKYGKKDTGRWRLPVVNMNLAYAAMNDSIRINGLTLDLQGLALQPAKNISIVTEHGSTKIELASLSAFPGKPVRMQVKQLQFSAPQLQLSVPKKFSLTDVGLAIPSFVYTGKTQLKPLDFFINQSKAKLHFSTRLHTAQGTFVFHRLAASLPDSLLQLDSLSFQPVYPLANFFAHQQWQQDFLQFHTGTIIFQQVDFRKLLTKPRAFRAQSAFIDQADLQVVKDKRLPMPGDSLKFLPTSMLQKIKFPLYINTVQLRNTRVTYTELPAKQAPILQVEVDSIQATLQPIKNKHLLPDDSLQVEATGSLNNIIPLKLAMHQAYADTSQAFRLAIQIPAFDVAAINQLQRSFTKIDLTQGTIGPVSLQATGDNKSATGNMQLHSGDIQIQAYRPNDSTKVSFMTRLKYFIANTFILKKEKTRSGDFQVDRNPGRSVYNYWVRMMLAGIKSAAGIKKKK